MQHSGYYDNDLSTVEDVSGRDVDATPAKPGAAPVSTDDFSLVEWMRSVNDRVPLFSRAADTFETPEPSRLDNLIYTLQDKHIDLKRVTESIRKTGKDIADSINTYLQEELFHGRSAKRTKDFAEKELMPLMQMMQMRGIEMADFEEYLWMRHAEERNAQIAKINPDMPDGGSGIDTQEARDYFASLPADKRKHYEALAAKVDAINAGTRQTLVGKPRRSCRSNFRRGHCHSRRRRMLSNAANHYFDNRDGHGYDDYQISTANRMGYPSRTC